MNPTSRHSGRARKPIISSSIASPRRQSKQWIDRLQVGGPATAKNEWITEFLDFCEKNNVPADFVSTHHYPTDALGSVGEDTETQLAHSQRSILREWAQDTHRKARGKPLYYTEWSSSSNPRDHLHDEPYTAAVIIKTMMEARGLVQGYSYWTFTDIFEENYMPATAFQGGFGLLTLQGVAKPSYRAFELLHRLGVEELPVDGVARNGGCLGRAGPRCPDGSAHEPRAATASDRDGIDSTSN